jgi:LuxR family transcriptional regulator, maltose regulon positive regulatory protein
MKKSSKPLVTNGVLIAAGPQSRSSPLIEIESPEWYAWLSHNDLFVYNGSECHFTARREIRRGKPFWYAYLRHAGVLNKAYLGKSDELGLDRLEQIGAQLRGKTEWLLPSPGGVYGAGTASAAAESAFAVSVQGHDPLLSLSKMKPQALPRQLVVRPRLLRRLNLPVTLICAPSGFGKSTLLSEWRQLSGIPVAWVSLDADDNSVLRFWSSVLSALQIASPQLARGLLAKIHLSSESPILDIVAALSNEILRTTDSGDKQLRLGLILDDYHHIDDPEIHGSIQALLTRMPPGFQVVISSRTRPPVPLGYLRAAGIVTELEADDFRFTLEEGVDLLERHTTGHFLTRNDMQELVQRTEGWAAGLYLATLALAKQGDPQRLMEAFTGTHTFLREYFAESVLYRLPSAVQAFLIKTSILKQLTGPLCDAITGQTGGADLLDQLCNENSFVVQLEEKGWYRYHDLFAEMLYNQLEILFPDDLPRLHRRAAKWYRRHNAPSDAVHHLLAINAWEDAAALIESKALHDLTQLGEDSQLLRWLNQLPEGVMQRHKTLLFVYLRLAEVGISQPTVEQFLLRVESNIIRKPEDQRTSEEQDILTEISQIRHAWQTNDPVGGALPGNAENNDEWQLLNGLVQFRRYWRNNLHDAAATLRSTYETALERNSLFVMLMAGGFYADMSYSQGLLRRSEKIAHQVLEQTLARHGRLPEPSSIALGALARVCYGRNQLDKAEQYLLRASTVDPNPTSTNMLVRVAIQRSLIELAQGHAERARATLQQARELNTRRPSGLWLDQDLIAYQAQCYLREGDIAAAEAVLSTSNVGGSHTLCNLVQAGIALSRSQLPEAETLLNEAIQQYPCNFTNEPIQTATTMLAIVLFEQRKLNQACKTLKQVLRQSLAESFIRSFLDHGARIGPLLTFFLQTELLDSELQSFVRVILHTLQPDNHDVALSKNELDALIRVASISVREQEVLMSLSDGLSNGEISDRLAISENTVKTHLENIYRKLGVNSRTQAIAQVRALMQ